MDSNNFNYDLFKKKVAYPYEYFTQSASGAFGNLDTQSASGIFREPLNLAKEGFWSILKQETPPDEEINRTQEIIRNFNIKNKQELTMLYLKMYVLNLLMSLRTLLRSLLLCMVIFRCTVTQHQVIHGKLDCS